MALQAPVIDITTFGQLAQESQRRSGSLMNAAWSSLSQVADTEARKVAEAQMTQTQGAAPENQGQFSASLRNYGQASQGAYGGSPSTRELMAKTLQAEAGGEGYNGMLAAGAVIMNRANAGGYGKGVDGVIMKPGQFSAWNGVTGYANGQGALDMDKIRPNQHAYAAADALLSGNYQDPTGGATHYYNPAVANPAWGQRAGGNWTRIGNHIFGFADGVAGRSQPVMQTPPTQYSNSSPWLSLGQPV